jgi:hypothetical protein
LVAQCASGFNLEIELKNIILRRVSIFEFLHSQGHSRRFGRTTATSGMPLPAQPVDATQALNGRRNGRSSCLKGAMNGLMHRRKQQLYSITSSARASRELGTVIPKVLAVFI